MTSSRVASAVTGNEAQGGVLRSRKGDLVSQASSKPDLQNVMLARTVQNECG